MTERAPKPTGRDFLEIRRDLAPSQWEGALQPRDYINVPWGIVRRWVGMPPSDLPVKGRARVTFIGYENDSQGGRKALVVASGHWGRIDPSLIYNYNRDWVAH